MVAESGALVEQGKKNRYLGDNWTKESKLTSSAGPARKHRVPVPTRQRLDLEE